MKEGLVDGPVSGQTSWNMEGIFDEMKQTEENSTCPFIIYRTSSVHPLGAIWIGKRRNGTGDQKKGL